MGLDIFFHKVKPTKNVDTTNPYAVCDFDYDQLKSKVTKYLDKMWCDIQNTTSIVERTKLIKSIRNYCRRNSIYSYMYEDITPELTNKELADKIDNIKELPARECIVYFRKVNFVYAYFAPYLVEEACIVSKDMVKGLIERCKTVIAAAKKDGIIGDDEKINPKLYYQYRKDENFVNITRERRDEEEARIKKLQSSLPTNWIKTAENVLPTQSGFFFGSTEYTPYYVRDVVDCRNQLEKLLKSWKDNEVVCVIMSW